MEERLRFVARLERMIVTASRDKPLGARGRLASCSCGAWPGEVVEDGQDAEATAIAELIKQEIERPATKPTRRIRM